jgi:hypothetical protein
MKLVEPKAPDIWRYHRPIEVYKPSGLYYIGIDMSIGGDWTEAPFKHTLPQKVQMRLKRLGLA